MSYSIPSCPKCQQPMQTGFVVDRTYGANLQTKWMAGEPQEGKLFGMSTGTLSFDEKQGHPITCFRCSDCSYLEFYAFLPQTSEAETVLLRPAQGVESAEAQQLLRGAVTPEEYAND